MILFLSEIEKLLFSESSFPKGCFQQADFQLSSYGNGNELAVWHFDIHMIAFPFSLDSSCFDEGPSPYLPL